MMTPVQYLSQYPAAELHRLIVDGRLLVKENGWKAFEKREPGCLQDFFTALTFIREHIGTKLSLSLLCSTHALAARNAMRDSMGKPGMFYQDHTGMGAFLAAFGMPHDISISKNSCSVAGIQQFIDRIEQEGHKYLGMLSCGEFFVHMKTVGELREKHGCKDNAELAALIYQSAQNGKALNIKCIQPENMPERVQWILDDYYEALPKANSQEEKLRVIVEHVQLLEQLHPYDDVNNRTFIGLTLLKCLLENDFIPVTLWDYNIFDLYSIDEICALLKEGMKHTKAVVAGKAVLDFDSRQLSAKHRAELAEHTKIFRQAMSADTRYLFHELKFRFSYLDLLSDAQNKLDTGINHLAETEGGFMPKLKALDELMRCLYHDVKNKVANSDLVKNYKEHVDKLEDDQLKAICLQQLAEMESEENLDFYDIKENIQRCVMDKFSNKEFMEKVQQRGHEIGQFFQAVMAFIHQGNNPQDITKIIEAARGNFVFDFEREIFPPILDAMEQRYREFQETVADLGESHESFAEYIVKHTDRYADSDNDEDDEKLDNDRSGQLSKEASV